MNMRVITVVFGLAIGTALASPSFAGNGAACHKSTALGAWVDVVEQRIDENLRYPELAARRGETGSAFVTFTRGVDGQPTNVVLSKSSGSGLLDRAALRTVKALGALPSLPGGYGDDQPVTVSLNYGIASGRMSEVRLATQFAATKRDAVAHNTQLAAKREATGTAAVDVGDPAAGSRGTADTIVDPDNQQGGACHPDMRRLSFESIYWLVPKRPSAQ